MADETTTNPVDGDDTASATVADEAGVDTEGQETEPQLDDEGNPIAEPDEEDVDLDDDLKLTVPKAVAQKLKELKEGSLRQADYTRKTQAHAEEVKAFNIERQAIGQATQEELGAYARTTSLAEQIGQYQNIDWRTWQRDDPFAAQEAFTEYTLLKDSHQQAFGRLQQLRNQRLSTAQQETAKRLEETRLALAKDIPGWSDAVEAQVADFGVKGYGFTREEMADMKIDPRIAKAFHRLHTLEESAKKQQKAQSNVAAQGAKPAARIGGASAPATGLDDRLSTAEWMRRRTTQAQKRA